MDWVTVPSGMYDLYHLLHQTRAVLGDSGGASKSFMTQVSFSTESSPQITDFFSQERDVELQSIIVFLI